MKWRYETCKRCHRRQRMIWKVKDSLWTQIAGKWKNRVRCLECFLELSDRKKISLEAGDFHVLGWLALSYKGDYFFEDL